MQPMNPLVEAVRLLGGYSATGRVCGVSYKAVAKWVKRGKLPRTEATGETRYALLLAAADPRIDADRLRRTVMVTDDSNPPPVLSTPFGQAQQNIPCT